MKNKCDIGVIGLAVMGQNLVLNMESSGYNVAVYNRTKETTEKFLEKRTQGKNIYPGFDIEEFLALLSRPRKVMLMVKSGKPVDYVIDSMLPYLEEGDIIIDGGNSHFTDTDRRYKELAEKGISFLGTGISGGEYGALHGPSIMPGGDQEAYQQVAEIFEDIAAKTDHGSCVTYLGKKSAGHYVKMIHNGIEYGVMQVIAEIYDFMRKMMDLSAEEMSSIFEEWNEYHQSYLLEITHEILKRVDPETEKPIVDIILDEARQKGTGKWSVQESLELGVFIPTITAAVNARNISAYKQERLSFSKVFNAPESKKLDRDFLNVLEDALYLGVVNAYAEGMTLLQEASQEYNYSLPLGEVARIWENGCIIRSAFLEDVYEVYKDNYKITSMILSKEFRYNFQEKIPQLRLMLIAAKERGIPVPAMSATLDYFDSLRSVELPTNLIQAQRDYFGAHTYLRRDKEGTFHTEWQDIKNV